MVGNDLDRLIDLLGTRALQGESVFCGHGASYAGACPGGGVEGRLAIAGVDRMTMGHVLCVPMIPVSIEPERYRMKRLAEWINLITAVIRLCAVITCMGWLGPERACDVVFQHGTVGTFMFWLSIKPELYP